MLFTRLVGPFGLNPICMPLLKPSIVGPGRVVGRNADPQVGGLRQIEGRNGAQAVNRFAVARNSLTRAGVNTEVKATLAK